MSFRLRRSKLLPGVRLNVGKRGISTSIGVPGAHVTFGRSGTRTTVKLPGSGLSYTHFDKSRQRRAPASTTQIHPEASPDSAWRARLWTALIIVSVLAVVLVTAAQS
jgi:hypothetical protein